MLEPNNRTDYGFNLMPQPGYKTEFAIGTTYSLELETMLVVPLALFHSKYLSEATREDNLRCDMLDALQQVKDRVMVFVHADNIKVGKDHSMLFNYLDRSIYNVNMPENSSFHPKLWLIKYINPNDSEDYKYRLVVMSRNLSSSTDFDLMAAIDGEFKEDETTENRSLLVFMQDLLSKVDSKSDKDKRDRILKALQKDLIHIQFEIPDGFSTTTLYPQIREKLKFPLLEKNTYNELLIISPFIDDNALKQVLSTTKPTGLKVLVSRQEELDKIDRNVLKQFGQGNVYQFSSFLENVTNMEISPDNKEEIEFSNDDANQQEISNKPISLHAKLFVVNEKDGNGNTVNHLFLGSTDCTSAAFEHNTECMIGFTSYTLESRVSELVKSMTDPKNSIIEEYHVDSLQIKPDKEELNNEQEIRRIKYLLSNLEVEAKAELVGQNDYRVSIKCNNIDNYKKINEKAVVDIFQFKGDNKPWKLQKEPNHTYDGTVSCQQLSPFFEVRITYKGESIPPYLMMGKMEIPLDRETKMLAEILDSEDKVMKYLMFFLDDLTDADMLIVGNRTRNSDSRKTTNIKTSYFETPIYEKMLLAASRHRDTLKRMQESIEKIKKQKGADGEPLLKKDFLDFWKNFEKICL